MKIPASPDAIDRAWLTSALKASGAIRGAVARFETAPLEGEEGLFGQLSRIHVTYDGDEPNAPRSFRSAPLYFSYAA